MSHQVLGVLAISKQAYGFFFLSAVAFRSHDTVSLGFRVPVSRNAAPIYPQTRPVDSLGPTTQRAQHKEYSLNHNMKLYIK